MEAVVAIDINLHAAYFENAISKDISHSDDTRDYESWFLASRNHKIISDSIGSREERVAGLDQTDENANALYDVGSLLISDPIPREQFRETIYPQLEESFTEAKHVDFFDGKTNKTLIVAPIILVRKGDLNDDRHTRETDEYTGLYIGLVPKES